MKKRFSSQTHGYLYWTYPIRSFFLSDTCPPVSKAGNPVCLNPLMYIKIHQPAELVCKILAGFNISTTILQHRHLSICLHPAPFLMNPVFSTEIPDSMMDP